MTSLSAAMSEALAPLRQRDSGHDPGRVALDVAVMLADGGEAIADLAVLRNQSELFGPVASDATAWRVQGAIDDLTLGRIRAARARARELAWAQAAETGRWPHSTVDGHAIAGLVLDIDATIVSRATVLGCRPARTAIKSSGRRGPATLTSSPRPPLSCHRDKACARLRTLVRSTRVAIERACPDSSRVRIRALNRSFQS